jgi:3-isopropylmalate dehydrogenase
MFLTVKLMLNYLEEKELAQRLENSIAQVIEEGKVRTYDLGGTSSTLDVAREIAKKVISNE